MMSELIFVKQTFYSVTEDSSGGLTEEGEKAPAGCLLWDSDEAY